jgi:hypothetical protein
MAPTNALEKKLQPPKTKEALFIDDKMAQSQSSDEDADEHLDCVHDIHLQR